jgi:hypothetical protein
VVKLPPAGLNVGAATACAALTASVNVVDDVSAPEVPVTVMV